MNNTQWDSSKGIPAHQVKRVNWLKLALIGLALSVISVALSVVLIHVIRAHFTLPKNQFIGYLSVFAIILVLNLSFIPIPFVITVLIAAATAWNPLLVALAGSVGSCMGEMSGYYAGVIGKKIAIPDDLSGYRRMKTWIDKYGFWAIAFISFQPLLPVEVAGIISGAARMPVRKFLPALILGKFPKYVILVYAGLGIIHFVPFLKL